MWQCPKCGAEGELPPVEGEMFCPRCGERFRAAPEEPLARARSEARPRLGPDRRLPVRDGRPPLQFERRWLVRLCVALLHPIVCLCLTLRQRKMEARVNAILDEIAHCRNREELERLLGPPLYAVSGDACGPLRTDAADLIECYETGGCCIDLWFKNDRLVDVSGFVKPTVWDSVLTQKISRTAS